MATKDSYLVVGGSGFLGRKIVEALVARGDKNVSVFDIVQRHFDVTCYTGDITDEEAISNAIVKSAATCIIHTAAPPATAHTSPDVFVKVNVEGTKTILASAIAHKVPKFVYTSSAGCVYNATDLVDCDERMPVPEPQVDAYNKTKAQAEALVLAANGENGTHTVAIRPSGIFGPGDRSATPGIMRAAANNETRFQIGDNCNVFDWTYVDNVVKAHLLAADRLLEPALASETVKTKKLPPIDVTLGRYAVPTSSARPPGPALEITPEIENVHFAFKKDGGEQYKEKAQTRGKFDPLTEDNMALEPLYPLQVAGQAFFITNGEPMYFWDFIRAMAFAAGYPPSKSYIKIPQGLGLVLGVLSEAFSKLRGREPGFTRERIYYTTAHRYFNIEKARRVLGYEPDVGIEEGIRRTVDWWKSEGSKAKS